MRYLQTTVFCLLACCVSVALALQSPRAVVKDTVIKLQKEVSQQHASLASSPSKLYAIVKRVIMPSVDVSQMSALALGPLWRSATPAERTAFVNQFSMLLTHTYANALLTVSNYNINVRPMRNNDWEHSNQAVVSGSVMAQGGGNSSSVIYYLVRNNDSWKIYDFVIDGVSFIQNYRSQFASFKSLSELNKKIEALNQRQAK